MNHIGLVGLLSNAEQSIIKIEEGRSRIYCILCAWWTGRNHSCGFADRWAMAAVFTLPLWTSKFKCKF